MRFEWSDAPFLVMHRPARADTGRAQEAGGSASGPGVKWSAPSTRYTRSRGALGIARRVQAGSGAEAAAREGAAL